MAPTEVTNLKKIKELETRPAAAKATVAQQSAETTTFKGRLIQLQAQFQHGAADAAASDASSPPDRAEPPPAIPHALMLVLSCLDDAGLRREFDAHADLAALAASAEDKGERRMSKDGLAKFVRDKGLAHGDAEVERVMKRVDANKDGGIDFPEFCALARANSDLELMLRSRRLECVLASFSPSGTRLEDLGNMDHAQFSAIVNLSQPAMVQLLVDLAAQVAAVGKAQDGAGGSKFSGELKGGNPDAFYEGVTGVCGEPDTDIEKGMREEHTMHPDSHVKFSTSNYGLTTTPSKEWALVLEGGSGCAKVEGKEGSVSVTGTRGCCKKGKTQPDLRVLRPIAFYGDFGEDGRLKWGVGDEVVVGEAFNVTFEESDLLGRKEEEKKEIAKDTEGKVLEVNAEGAAKIAFREPVSEEHWVPKDQFFRMFPLPNARETPIQRRVKLGRLRRCEVRALVLYTGPMFTLYNALLRGFGFCGAVAEGIEFASDEFWAQWKAVDINAWVKRSGHRFTNTIHALASAIKKLQGLAAEEPSTRLYRGLGGLSVAAFAASCGFTDKAFMSTTKDRESALEYSGVHKGLVGTVLCIETSTTNNGAVISEFSQYPGEEETVWNACSFLQHLPGREEVVLPPGVGVVRTYHVLVSANSRAETVEQLEGRRKRVVVQVLDTLHADVCRAVDAAVKTAEFEKRVAQDERDDCEDDFISSVKDESAARVAVYKALPDGAYAAIEVLGEAVSKGLALVLLAKAKLRLWLEDPSLSLYDMDWKVGNPSYLCLNAAQGRRLAKRRLLLQDSSAAGRLDGVGRIVVEDGLGRMGGKATAAFALEDCRERRLVTGAGAEALERKDLYTQETPLIAQVQLGEYEDAKCLLQAGADANAETAGGERALLIAAKEGREDLVELLVDFKAEVDGCDANTKTVLHWASEAGHLAVVQALLKAGANTTAKDNDGRTVLMLACDAAVVQALLKAGADIEAKDEDGRTALMLACEEEKEAAAAELMEATKNAGALDVQSRDGYPYHKRSALHWASLSGLESAVAKLLSLGADAALKDENGETALDLATNDVVKAALRQHGAKHSLFCAAKERMLELLADLIKGGR
jgi:uncharacterized protein